MKAEHINAYIQATKQLLEVMFNIEKFEKKFLNTGDDTETTSEVSAVIGIAGACTGAVVLSFTKEVAIKMVSQLVGEDIIDLDNDTCDALGEMVNIIAGNASRALESLGVGTLKISVPTVLIGKDQKVNSPGNIPSICIGFETDLGHFVIHVSLECA